MWKGNRLFRCWLSSFCLCEVEEGFGVGLFWIFWVVFIICVIVLFVM